MSNQYEGSAVAESDERIGVLAANNTAEQQNSVPEQMSSAQLLYSVVAHNVANPEKRITLSRDQGKEIMKDFVNFVAGSSAPPTTEDGRIKTFNEMDDGELLKCLSEYLGSGIANSTINGAGIEAAQELIAEQYMSEEELEELPNPKTPNGRAAREKKLLEVIQDAAEDMQKRMEDRSAAWDKDLHSVGKYKFTGAQLHAAYEYLQDPENADEYEQILMAKYNLPRAEARKQRVALQEYLTLQEKDGRGETLTPEERYKLDHPTTQVAERLKDLDAQLSQGNQAKLDAKGIERYAAEQDVSVRAGNEDFSEKADVKTIKSDVTPLMASSNLIKTSVDLTSTYNANSNVVLMENIAAQPEMPVLQKQAAATVQVSANAAFS